MAGHSKWANRKHRKARQDSKRAKIFTKISKEIYIAAKAGGEDTNTNVRLRMALDLARENNMPNDNIKRAIAKALGNSDNTVYEEFAYEGYGPGGIAIMVEIATDNRNRTAADVRHYFSKYGGSLGQNGCVAWMFKRRGVIRIDREDCQHHVDYLLETLLEAGGDDLVTNEDEYIIYTAPEDLISVKEKLKDKGVTGDETGVEFIPDSYQSCSVENSEKLIALLEALEDHDDVQRVYYNARFN